eukprot:gene17190-23686_t
MQMQHDGSNAVVNILTDKTIIARTANPLHIAPRLCHISANSHIYWNQWRELHVDLTQFVAFIELIKRFEANGLQLKGKGLWFLSMLLKESILTFDIPKETIRLIVEILFHIGVEYEVSFLCVDILHHFIDNSMISAEELFNIGLAVSDIFPIEIPTSNFIELLQFVSALVKTDKIRGCS